jgi:hypothetical protein
MVWASQVMRAERIQGAEGDLLLVVAAGDAHPPSPAPGPLDSALIKLWGH